MNRGGWMGNDRFRTNLVWFHSNKFVIYYYWLQMLKEAYTFSCDWLERQVSKSICRIYAFWNRIISLWLFSDNYNLLRTNLMINSLLAVQIIYKTLCKHTVNMDKVFYIMLSKIMWPHCLLHWCHDLFVLSPRNSSHMWMSPTQQEMGSVLLVGCE